VDKDLAKDARQVMDRIIYNVDKGIAIEEVSEEDDALFESYFNKFIDESEISFPDYDDVNETIKVMISGLLVNIVKG